MRVHARCGPPDPVTAERLLGLLPDWFGVETATAQYVQDAAWLPTYTAHDGAGPAIGIALVRRHFPVSAEVHLMAVHPDWHRRGVGRALLAALEADLAADGVRILQVKTLGASCPDGGYERTRQFFLGVGFLPLEEFPDLWPDNPCLLMAKALSPPVGTTD